MPENKIEAHVQFNGTNFQVFLTKQPGLSCSTPDCSECKKVSEKLNADQDAATQEAIAKSQTDAKARVDQAAKDQMAQAEIDKTNAAARAKGQALRISGLAWKESNEKAETDAAVARAQEIMRHQDALKKIDADLADALTAANIKRANAENEINAKDWLKETEPKAQAPAADPAAQAPAHE